MTRTASLDFKEAINWGFNNLSTNEKPIEISGKAITYSNRRDVTCPRCYGEGYLQQFSHIQNGICFLCDGHGLVAENSASSFNKTNRPRLPDNYWCLLINSNKQVVAKFTFTPSQGLEKRIHKELLHLRLLRKDIDIIYGNKGEKLCALKKRLKVK